MYNRLCQPMQQHHSNITAVVTSLFARLEISVRQCNALSRMYSFELPKRHLLEGAVQAMGAAIMAASAQSFRLSSPYSPHRRAPK
jgi:hypothetical protein